MGSEEAPGVFIEPPKTAASLVVSSRFAKESDLTAELLLLFYYCCVWTLINSWELKNTSKQNIILILGFCVSFVA